MEKSWDSLSFYEQVNDDFAEERESFNFYEQVNDNFAEEIDSLSFYYQVNDACADCWGKLIRTRHILSEKTTFERWQTRPSNIEAEHNCKPQQGEVVYRITGKEKMEESLKSRHTRT
jgi:hypothetical protein